MDWTVEKIRELVELRNRELSAGQIANKMGISRNAVIGKLHRLGLGTTPKVPPKKEKPKQPVLSMVSKKAVFRPLTLNSKPLRWSNGNLAVAGELVAGEEYVADISTGRIKAVEPVTLLALQDHHCRAPLDSGLFCGATKTDDSSYCRKHRELFIERTRIVR